MNPHTDFDYPALEADDVDEPEMERLGLALAEIFSWQAGGRADAKQLRPQTVGLRAIAALWVVRPALIGAPSLLQLSKRLGCSDSILSRYASEFRDRYRIKGTGQRSDRTRAKMRTALRRCQ